MSNLIIEKLNNPTALEKMFRTDPEGFIQTFDDAWKQNPDSEILAVWYERLHFKEEPVKFKDSSLQKDFIFMGILAILAGIGTRIIFQFTEWETISPVNLIFGVLPFIAAYFVQQNRPQKQILYALASLFGVSIIYLNLLPLETSDSIILAYLHLPVFMWVILGLAFTGDQYKLGGARLAYLKFNGEFAILYAIMAISGMLLTAITMQLFGFIGMNIEEFYFRNVVLFGAASLAVVAAYLVSKNLKLAKNIAPTIARIFSPLVLVTLVVYLLVVIWVGKNPFIDRDFLLSFNFVLFGVLAVTIFSITEGRKGETTNLSDYINVALIFLALVIDSVALSAIVFRLSSFGISPNRLAVLGVNLLIWVNLILIMRSYWFFLKRKGGASAIEDAVTNYLPVYGIWAAFVVFTFPVIF